MGEGKMGEAGLKQRLNSTAAPIADVDGVVDLNKVSAAQAVEQQRMMNSQYADACKLPAVFVNMFLLHDAGPGNLRLVFGDQFNTATTSVMRFQCLMDLNMFRALTSNCVRVVEKLDAVEKANARLRDATNDPPPD